MNKTKVRKHSRVITKNDPKYKVQFLKFIDGLEKLSKQTGITIEVTGNVAYDEKIKKIRYSRDPSSGDIEVLSITI